MYAGVIEGIGPRLPPVDRRQDHPLCRQDGHQIFAEPEGLDHPRALPERDLHQPAVRRAGADRPLDPWLRECPYHSRPGYAIEYDFFDPRDLRANMESKCIENLFAAARSTAPPAMKRPLPRA